MMKDIKLVVVAAMCILGQVAPTQAFVLTDTKMEKEIVYDANELALLKEDPSLAAYAQHLSMVKEESESVRLSEEVSSEAYANHVSIAQEQIIGDPDHSHRLDGYINTSIFEWADSRSLPYINPDRIHPQILKYEDYILEKINDPQLDKLFEEVLGGRTYDKSIFIKDIVLAIMEVETGRGFSDDKNPSNENNGNGWGIFQIEDVSYGRSKTRSSQVDSKNKNEIIYTINLNDRLDPEKSIDWFIAHFHNLLWKANGDYSKAIQSYNYGIFGLQWLVEDYQEDWYQNLDKICDSIGERTGSMKNTYGDSQYLYKVLAYIK